MSATNELENSLLQLLFENAAAPFIGDAAGLQPSGAAGNWEISLHTSDPTESGDQSSFELTYTGYARVPVARSGAEWTVSGVSPTQVVNNNDITFGVCTAGSETALFVGLGYAHAGAGHLLLIAPLILPLAIGVGVIPIFMAGSLKFTLD